MAVTKECVSRIAGWRVGACTVFGVVVRAYHLSRRRLTWCHALCWSVRCGAVRLRGAKHRMWGLILPSAQDHTCINSVDNRSSSMLKPSTLSCSSCTSVFGLFSAADFRARSGNFSRML